MGELARISAAADQTLRGFVSLAEYRAVIEERDRLAEELAFHRSEAAFEAEAARRGPAAWALTRTEAYVMRLLASRALASRSLIEAGWPGGEDRHEKSVDVLLSKLRAKLARFGVRIENRRGLGWCLRPDIRERVRVALETGAPVQIAPPVRADGPVVHGDGEIAAAVLGVIAEAPAKRKALRRAAPGHTGRLTGVIARLERSRALTRRRVGREVWHVITPHGRAVLTRLQVMLKRRRP